MKVTFCSTQKIGKADPMIYGQFLEHHHRQVYGGVFDPGSKFADEDGFRTDVIDAMKKIKVPIIRWPGGCFVSAYDWHYGVGKTRLATYNKAWLVEEPNTFGTDEFVKFCRKVGCEPYICTNAGTGSAEEMSNWVEYCNLKDLGIFAKERIENRYPEPHNVKYWSIGNENYGSWEIGAKDADEWARLVCESAKMMYRVDPTLELSAAAISDTNWTIKLLNKVGHMLSWISVHGYYSGTNDGVHYDPYEELVLRTGKHMTEGLDRTRGILAACGLDKKIRIAVDEWNLRGWYHPNTMNDRHRDTPYGDEVYGERNRNDDNSTYNMADAVFSACYLNMCLKNCDVVGMACFSPIVNTRGAIFTHKDGIVLRPQYYVFDLYANLLKENVLNVWTENKEILDDGNGRVVDTVDAVVTCGDGEFAVSAVNKDKNAAHDLDLACIGTEIKEMRIHTLNGAEAESYNDIDRTDVTVKTSEWKPFTGSVRLEPHSVNVIELK